MSLDERQDIGSGPEPLSVGADAVLGKAFVEFPFGRFRAGHRQQDFEVPVESADPVNYRWENGRLVRQD
jgi:hypothetical protein